MLSNGFLICEVFCSSNLKSILVAFRMSSLREPQSVHFPAHGRDSVSTAATSKYGKHYVHMTIPGVRLVYKRLCLFSQESQKV